MYRQVYHISQMFFVTKGYVLKFKLQLMAVKRTERDNCTLHFTSSCVENRPECYVFHTHKLHFQMLL